MKKIVKFAVLLIVLGICACYTYQFITDHTNPDWKKEAENNDSENTEEAAGVETASPEKLQKLDIGWERVRYSFIPSLPDLMWTEFNEDYIVEVEDVSYRVTGASVQKEWNPKWKFEVLISDCNFGKDKRIKGKKSFVSVRVALKNVGQKVCACYLNSIILHIYDGKGESIYSGMVETASLEHPVTKSYYRKKVKPKEKLETEVVYLVQDKYLQDEYYYFVEVLPWASEPKTKKEIGIFKLPLGNGDYYD